MYSVGVVDGPAKEHIKWIHNFTTIKDAKEFAREKCADCRCEVMLIQKLNLFKPHVSAVEEDV